jgi:hypothetical protein
MGWQTNDEDLAKVMDAAIADANRTLEMKATGGGYAKVRYLMVEEWVYDEDLDELVLTGNIAVRHADGEWAST